MLLQMIYSVLVNIRRDGIQKWGPLHILSQHLYYLVCLLNFKN